MRPVPVLAGTVASRVEGLDRFPGQNSPGYDAKEVAPIRETGWMDHACHTIPAKPKKAKKGEIARSGEEEKELRLFIVNRVLPFIRDPDRPEAATRAFANTASAGVLFDAMRAKLPNLHAVLGDLEQVCHAARLRVRQQKLHWFLHGWLLVHIPAAAALLLLIAVHIVAALRY
jgi:hypothetical protein